MFKVIEHFHDLTDQVNGEYYEYNVGDEYPREGAKPSEERIEELKTALNGQGKSLIVEEASEETTKEAEAEPVEAPKTVKSGGKKASK